MASTPASLRWAAVIGAGAHRGAYHPDLEAQHAFEVSGATDVVLGTRYAKKPIELKIPITIAGMSFGALSANAILALNAGAKRGNFAHDTGEGSISRHHRVHGGDLIWEIGSGYFGC